MSETALRIRHLLNKLSDALLRLQVYYERRAEEQANVRAGGYTNGTPMAHSDKVIYAWLTRVSIGGLALLLVGVTILVTLGAVGK